MDFLKKLFPMSFQKSADVSNLVRRIVVYAIGVVLAVMIAVIVGFLDNAALGALIGFFVSVVETYCTAGIVLAILVHCNVIKLDNGNNNNEEN